MFRVIGGAVVYGLALYGVVKLFDRPKIGVVIQSDDKQDERKRPASTADGTGGGEPAVAQASDTSSHCV